MQTEKKPLKKSQFELLKHNTRGREDIIAGSVASAVSRFCVAPFDVLKIRFQLDTGVGDKRRYQSLYGATRDILRREGIRAFWKGNLAATLMVVPYGAGAFLTQQQLKLLVLKENRKPTPLFSIFSGSAAGLCGTIVSYPLDLLRTRLAGIESYTTSQNSQSPIKVSHMRLFDVLRESIRARGLRGLYDGLSPALLGIVPYMGLQFGIYDEIKQLYNLVDWEQFSGIQQPVSNSPIYSSELYNQLNTKFRNIIANRSLEPLICGSVAGFGSKFLTMPFDVLKKRYQIANFPLHNGIHELRPSRHLSPPVKVTFYSLSKSIYQNEGLRGFYRGIVPALVKAVPSSGITFAVYELCTRILVNRSDD